MGAVVFGSADGCLRTIDRIGVDGMPRTLAFQTATLLLQVIDQFVPLHTR